MRNRCVALCIGLLGCTAYPVLAGVADGKVISSTFRGDERLTGHITLAERDRPLRDILADLTHKLRVSLKPAPDTADDKATLYIRDRPAAEVLSLVADHFDFEWARRGDGYQLRQSEASKRREAARREADVAAQLARIQARMERIAQLAAQGYIDPDRRANRSRELTALLAEAGHSPEEQARFTEDRAGLNDLGRSGATAAVAAYACLSPAQLSLLRTRGQIQLSTADRSLPTSVATEVRRSITERLERSPLGDTLADPALAGQPVEPPRLDVAVRLSDLPGVVPWGRPQGARRLELGFLLSSTRIQSLRYGPHKMFWALDLGSYRPSTATRAPVTDNPLLKQEIQPLLGSRRTPEQILAAGEEVFLSYSYRGVSPPAIPTLGEISEALHRTAALNVVADSFVRARLDPSHAAACRTLGQLLEKLSRELDYDAHLEGRLLRLRSRSYYRDRVEEVPSRILQPWGERVTRAGAPLLDDLADLSAALSDPQARSLDEFWGWYLEGARILPLEGSRVFHRHRHPLRFWASLGAEQRRTVMAGRTLPVRGMSVPQRQALNAVLASRWEPSSSFNLPNEPNCPPPPTPEAVALGGFAVMTRTVSVRLYQSPSPDGQPRRNLRRGPDGGAAPTPQPDEKPAGPSFLLSEFAFKFLVAGTSEPAHTAWIQIPRVKNVP